MPKPPILDYGKSSDENARAPGAGRGTGGYFIGLFVIVGGAAVAHFVGVAPPWNRVLAICILVIGVGCMAAGGGIRSRRK